MDSSQLDVVVSYLAVLLQQRPSYELQKWQQSQDFPLLQFQLLEKLGQFLSHHTTALHTGINIHTLYTRIITYVYVVKPSVRTSDTACSSLAHSMIFCSICLAESAWFSFCSQEVSLSCRHVPSLNNCRWEKIN